MKKYKKYEHIIQTALEIFSEKGYENTSMDEIAQKANVNKATIYYHIGSKEKLYSCVFKDNLTHIINHFEKLGFKIDDGRENLKRFILTFLNLPEKKKLISKIMLKEVSTQWKTLPKDVFPVIKKVMDLIISLLNYDLENNKLNTDDKLLVHVYILSSILFLNNLPEIRSKIKSSQYFDDIPDTSRDKEIEHYINFIINGLYKGV